ncbi:MAG: tRNA 2-thiocytidine(32) synthetase TtcA [Granulosicoccus sp.]|nr:tRNA 2-thiocytidine(32) synthetase TtcA [Granulosicoccus sp.]
MTAPTRVGKRLQGLTGRAVIDFKLIEANDRVMVCLSGGKDSYTLLDMLLHLQHVAPIKFSLVAVNLDQKQPGFPEDILPDYLTQRGLDFRIVEEDTYSIVKAKIPEGQTTCSLCSRLRRGILYRVGEELGATKIALGHHADDLLETMLLNLFYSGSLKTMPAKLRADNGKSIVIRPLVYCREKDIIKFSQEQAYPIIPCNLCGSQENLKRQSMKSLLASWERDDPNRIASMISAMSNVKPSHLLDRSLFDFDTNQRITDPQSDVSHNASQLTMATHTIKIHTPTTTEFPARRTQ